MSELLQPRNPITDPRPADKVAIDSTQYEVLSRDGSSITYKRLERGRRRSGAMSLAGWQDKMKAATVVSVSNCVATAKR